MTTPSQQRGYASATAAAQASLAASFYSSQAFLAAWSIQDILRLWQQLQLRDVRSSWPAIRTGIASLIESRFGMSVMQAATYYQQARIAAGVTGLAPQYSLPSPFPSTPPAVLAPAPSPAPAGPPAVTVPPPSQQLIQATLDSTGPYALLGRIKQAQPVTKAAETTGVVMSGAASRLIMNGARQVVIQSVQADKDAVGWMRVLGTSRTGPCAFCAMLATRVDYKTKKAALSYWHDHCKCTAQPLYSKEDAQALLDHGLYQQWKDATKGYSKHEAFLAWRRYWDAKIRAEGRNVLAPVAA